MIIIFNDHILNSPSSYFMDLGMQLSEYVAGSVFCHINDIEKYISYHDVIFLLRGAGFEKSKLFKNKRVILYFDDVHYYNDKSKNSRINIFELADIILVPGIKQFLLLNEFKTYHNKAVWLPFHVPKICQNIKEVLWQYKINKALLTGRSSDAYAFRNKIISDKNLIIDVLKHPGYKGKFCHNIISENYYDKISLYKGSIVTSGNTNYRGFNLQYTVQKYFEIPSCGVVPFIQETEDLQELGFKDNENCIFINEKNYIDKIKENLDNFKLAQTAKQFIFKNHTFQNRFNEILSKIL